jgi:hypothetical protein
VNRHRCNHHHADHSQQQLAPGIPACTTNNAESRELSPLGPNQLTKSLASQLILARASTRFRMAGRMTNMTSPANAKT